MSSLGISGCLELEECDQGGSHSPEIHQSYSMSIERRIQRRAGVVKIV